DSTNAVIFGGAGDYEYGGYAFGIYPNGALYLQKASGGEEVKTTNGVVDTDWHHVAVTKSGTSVIFYIDGVATTVPPFNATFGFDYVTMAIGGEFNNSGDIDKSFYG